MRTPALVLLTTALLVPAALAGCGSGDDDAAPAPAAETTAAETTPAETTPADTTSSDTPKVGSLTIKMTEFKFDPQDSTAKAGRLTISAPNDGKVEHELVILKTDADPADLPKKDGAVDESTSVGEIADVAPGRTKSKSFKLEPGKYALVCALPGHYEGGMYGSLTVTQ